MASVTFPIKESSSGTITIEKPLVESLLDEVFSNESEFEGCIIPRIGDLAILLGVEAITLIGRQVRVKNCNQPGRGLTLDLLAVSDTGRRFVIELKFAQDKYSVSQAYTYAAQLRDMTLETVCEMYAEFLSRSGDAGESVDSDEAAQALASVLGVEVELLDSTEILEPPAIVVITPMISPEEYVTASAMTDDGNIVVLIQSTVHSARGTKHVIFERCLPAMEPAMDNRTRLRKRRADDDSDAAGDGVVEMRKGNSDSLLLNILKTLEALPAGSKGITSKELRAATGSGTDFTRVINELAELGHIERVEGESERPGRKPIMNSITSEGREALTHLLRSPGSEHTSPPTATSAGLGMNYTG